MEGAEALSAHLTRNAGVAGHPGTPVVFWDGYGLGHAESGVGFHARALARELIALGSAPTLIADVETARAFGEIEAVTVPRPPVASRLFTSKPFWPLRVRQLFRESSAALHRPVVLHGLSNVNLPILPLPPLVRTVLTVHDLIPFLEPGGVSRAYLLQLKALLPRAVATADRIVCVSEWTRRTLLERFPAADGKTVVVKNGRPELTARLGRKTGPLVRLLYVARHEGYKRVELFSELVRRRDGQVHGTLITDARGVEWAKAHAAGLIRDGRLRVLTGLSREDYLAAFDAADVYVSASRLEGFCLPAADALARGLPVVYQAGSGLDEVAGRACAAALSPQSSTDDWLRAVDEARRLSESESFATLLRRHLNTLPTWKDAARSLQSVYNDLNSSDH